ncbi:MAG: PAS domain S-box protein [Calditrichaceae bacterium]
MLSKHSLLKLSKAELVEEIISRQSELDRMREMYCFELNENANDYLGNTSHAIILSENSRISFVNKLAVQLFKASNQDDFIGRDIHDILKHGESGKSEKYSSSNSSNKSTITDFKGQLVDVSISHVRLETKGRETLLTILTNRSELETTEKALKESEERYAKLIKHSSDSIVIHRFGEILFTNPAAMSFFKGTSSENLTGKSIFEYVHPDYKKFVKKRVAEMKNTRQSVPVSEEKFLRKDGTVVDAEVIATPVIFRGEEAIQVIFKDVTERKKTEEALKQSEALFRTLADTAATAIFIYQGDTFKYVNRMTESISGYDKQELLKMNFWDIVHPDYRELVRERGLARQRGEQVSSQYELKILSKNGEDRWIDFTAAYIDYMGKPGGIGTAVDITERKKAENALSESEYRYRMLIETARDAIYSMRPDGTIASLNPAFERATGFPREEWVGKHFSELCHPEDLELAQQVFDKQMKGERTPYYELRIRRKDGGYILAEFTVSFKIENGKVILGIGIARDVTRRKENETAIKESELRYRQLFNLLPFGGEVIDLNGYIIDCSESEVQYLGYKRVELIGKHITELIDPGALNIYKEKFSQIREGNIIQAEIQMLKRDGKKIYVSRAARPLYDVKGNIVSVLAINVDITERKLSEDSLVQLVNRTQQIRDIAEKLNRSVTLQETFETVIRGIIKILNAHQSSVMVFGRGEYRRFDRHEKMYKTSIFEGKENFPWKSTDAGLKPLIIPDISQSELSKQIQSRLKKQGIVSCALFPLIGDHKILGKFAVYFPEPYAINKEQVNIGNVLAENLSAAIRRIQYQEWLNSEREKLSVTLGSIGDGVITTDHKGKIMLMNTVAETLTGWRESSAKNRLVAEVLKIFVDETGDIAQNPVEFVLDKKEIYHSPKNIFMIDRQNRSKSIEISAAPIRKNEGQVIGAVIAFRDVTDRKKLQEELLKSQKLESLGILAGGIAHDFNNILTAILGNVSLAKMYCDTDGKIFERLNTAERALMRAQDLTQQLLTFSKGGVPVKKTASIVELIKDSVEFVLRGTKIKYDIHFQENLWMAEVDTGQINQVINNIIINAIHSMPNGGTIYINLENRTITSQDSVPVSAGNYIKIDILDEGVGIPKKLLTRVFDPYFTTKKNGSGLGLATTFSIIKNHSGYITVDSKLGKGTRFRIYLPASEKTQNTIIKESEHSGKLSGKILFMDDDQIIIDLGKEIFSHLGCEMVPAFDGKEAVKLFIQARKEGKPFDLVIMDLTVPGGMGGKDAVAELLKIDPEIRVIVSSGYSNDPVMADYKKYGFSGVVKKPYNVQDMSKAIRKFIR